MQIAKECHGLPLSVGVMAGALAKEPMNKALWENIACSIGSYFVNEHKGNLEPLALSYHNIPHHLRECFIYLGGFPEDFRFIVKRLIWLWVAAGFIEEAENQSSEDTAKAYLTELINRNLVIVVERKLIGDVKACILHDLMRELCLQKAKEERFFFKIDSPPLASQLCKVIIGKPRHVFTNEDISIVNFTLFPTQTIRSFLCFHKDIHSIKVISHSFVLLKVLALQRYLLDDSAHELALLVHLRYLSIWIEREFPHSICKLRSLQTLILTTNDFFNIYLPRNITYLVNLRHLWSNMSLYLDYIGKPMNLHSVSKMVLRDGVHNIQECFPSIKKLDLRCYNGEEYDFKLLPYLETLKLLRWGLLHYHISFPATLKKLTHGSYFLPWSVMPRIQSLPNLEVLKLKPRSFKGRQWDACEQRFRQLKLLSLENINIKHWEASSTSFPCLKRLSLRDCSNLEEIPLKIGKITTLELIEIDNKSNSVVESVKRIQQEQHDVGNYDLKITVDGMELSFYLSRHEDSKLE